MSFHSVRRRRPVLLLLAAVAAALAVFVPIALATAVFNGSITNTDPTQNARLFRGGIPSTCGAPNAASTFAGTYHYDAYNLVNPTASIQCTTATLTAPNCPSVTNPIFAGSYVPTFNPASITTNVVGDPGVSPNGNTVNWGFNVPANSTYVVVVAEVTANAGCSAYTLTVSNDATTAAGVFGLSARREHGTVVLRWRVGSEARTLGYNVFRQVAGKRMRVNARLISRASQTGLHLYEYADRAAAGAARYWLQQVRLDGSRTWEGPVSVGG
jgi:hypothetical protein